MDGRGQSYSLHPLCHILFLFSQLFHLDAVRYMWLHCWPPTSAYRLMYRYCGLEAFAYVIKPIVPAVQNISCQAALNLFFFFLVLCIMYHNQSLHHTLHSSVKKKKKNVVCKVCWNRNLCKATFTYVKPAALWKESHHHVQVYSDLNLYACPIRSVSSVLVHNINNFISKDSADVSVFGFLFKIFT